MLRPDRISTALGLSMGCITNRGLRIRSALHCMAGVSQTKRRGNVLTGSTALLAPYAVDSPVGLGRVRWSLVHNDLWAAIGAGAVRGEG